MLLSWQEFLCSVLGELGLPCSRTPLCLGSSCHYPFILLSSEVPHGIAYANAQSGSKRLLVPRVQQRLAEGPSHWGRCPVVLPALCICRGGFCRSRTGPENWPGFCAEWLIMDLTWPLSLPQAQETVWPLSSPEKQTLSVKVPSSVGFVGYLLRLLIFKSSCSFVQIH